MFHLQNSVLLLSLFFTLPLSISTTSILYERNVSLDGKICKDSEISFRKKVMHNKSTCLAECVNHSDCKSVFHAQSSGDCTGCTVMYDLSNQPTGLVDGTIYYRQPGCPDGWGMFENSCYYITEEKQNFQMGVEICQLFNARAVIINGEHENNFLKTFIRTSMTSSDDDLNFLIGFTDTEVEGTWTAYDNIDEVMTFSNWEIGEPNGFTIENCISLRIHVDLRWIDLTCNILAKLICEKELF